MSRITLSLDSATADEAQRFVFAYQRVQGIDPRTREAPTVRMAGIGWGITTPPMSTDHAAEMMRDFSPAPDGELEAGSTSGYSDTDECLTCGAHLSDPHDPSCAATGATLVDPILSTQDAVRAERWSAPVV